MANHHVRHHRAKSNYPSRLASRGVRKTDVMMASVEDLRATQSARTRRTGSPWPEGTPAAESLPDDESA